MNALTGVEARKLLTEALTKGAVSLTPHALREMVEDNLAKAEVLNLLRIGAVSDAYLRGGQWRHLVEFGNIRAVVAFGWLDDAIIITLMRIA